MPILHSIRNAEQNVKELDDITGSLSDIHANITQRRSI